MVNHVYVVDKNHSPCKWIIDTCATDHITLFLYLLQDIHLCQAFLQLPKRVTAEISHVGNMVINDTLSLTNVLCVPSFVYNLLSISKLLKDTSYEVSFLANKCYLQDSSKQRILELGNEELGLYRLTHTTTHSEKSGITQSVSSSGLIQNYSEKSVQDRFIAHVHTSDVWHARMGHIPAKVIESLPVECKKKALDVCDSCYFAKQSRLQFSPSKHQSSDLFDLVHADLWGPYRFKTNGGYSYFLTLVEDKSRTTWIYLLSDKSSIPHIIKDFISLVQNQFHITIKALRTDNGTEFVNSSLDSHLLSLGIIHQTSCVYTPQQNGLVERKYRHLLNCAWALRFHAGLPIIFWGDCLLAAAYLINRTPTPVLNYKSPYEVLFGTVPEYDNLRVLGCLCYATMVPQPSDKFAPRSIKGVFLGYPYAKNG